MRRTDIHRPAAILPEDYRFVAFEAIKIEGIGDCIVAQMNRERIRADMARTGGTYSRHAHGGNCMVYGNANAIYTALFYHAPTNTYVRMGQDCAAKVEMGLDRAAFTRFRDGVHQWQEARAGKRKAEGALTERGLAEAWALYTAPGASYTRYEESTIVDIVSKLVRFGSISDKQYAFIERLLVKVRDRARTDAERAVETAAALPIPEEIVGKRATVIGKVLSVKVVESAYGGQTKMLVKTDAGWKLWVSVPSHVAIERGHRVKFDARIERSNDDPKFGFGSRPTNASIIEETATVAA